MEEMRVQKYVSDCGLMSRRSAEKEIEQGFFTVNGEKAYIGQKVVPGVDAVRYKGRKLAGGGKKVYLMLYKPRGYVTTLSDEEGRHCITELLEDVPERVYPCGRLDMDSEGLLIPVSYTHLDVYKRQVHVRILLFAPILGVQLFYNV